MGVALRNAHLTPVLASLAAMVDLVKLRMAPNQCVSVHLVLLAQPATLVNSIKILWLYPHCLSLSHTCSCGYNCAVLYWTITHLPQFPD